ncbi:MAG TPA: imidazole glycerol phosphate synthase subunit HisH [Sediminispirochaeta sp.]|mgnify:CR=1 FL=1|nr:imidazole glycerol phosphate synthase subunit HisH [Sediminispirochaeta sp.]
MGKIGIVNYEAGNLKSVETALSHLGLDFFVSAEAEELDRAERLIFPGVGEASSAMAKLREKGLDTFLTAYFKSGRPILGICLGAQIVLGSSEENQSACLDLVPGKARRFPSTPGLKVPHMGWNTCSYREGHYLFDGIPRESSFYFVHSYYPEPENSDTVIGTTNYGIDFCAALEFENLTAVQFHPEKSGKWGLKLLDNFARKRM